jgi:hypothetical protein
MGPAKYEKVVGKSQSVLMMINPMIFTRARMRRGGVSQARCGWATSGWRSSFRPSRATGRRWARPTGWRRRWCCAKAPVRDRTAGISPTISLCNMLASARLRFCVGSPTISLCSVLASVLAMTLSATDRRARRQDLGDGRLPREVRRLVAGNHSHRDGRECRCRRPSPVSTTPCRLWWLLRVCLARTAGSSVAGWSLPPCPAARPPAVVVVNAAAAAAAVPHLTSPDSPDFT